MTSDEHRECVDFEFEVGEEEVDARLDTAVTGCLGEYVDVEQGTLVGTEVVPSRSKVAQWITDGHVRVNLETITKPSYRLRHGAVVSVSVPPPKALPLEPDPQVPIEVVYEDEHLLVVNKPPGLVVHPGAGQWEATLVHGLLHYLGPHLRSVGMALRPGIVHRLDKDTSGLLVVARTDGAFQGLARQFLPPRTIMREYLALTWDKPRGDGSIDFPIARHPLHRKKMAVVESKGREAHTSWEVEKPLARGVLLRVRLSTGRTHQIRVHLSHMGAPIVGDPVYGKAVKGIPSELRPVIRSFGRQALHAARLSFVHPISGEKVECEAAPPEDMRELIDVFAG